MDVSESRTPEFPALLRHLRNAVVEGDKRPENGPPRPSDWTAFLKLADAHGVSSLLSRHLLTEDGTVVPDDEADWLRTRAAWNARRNLYLTGELVRLLGRFRDRKVRILPFKGPVLAKDLYGDVSRRTFADLDFLFDREEWPRVRAVMRSAEFDIDVESNLDYLSDREFARGESVVRPRREFKFTRGSDDLSVELRWRLGERLGSLDVSFDRLWDRRERTTLLGTEVPRLASADRLVVLGYHGTKHRWSVLKWVTDLAAYGAAVGSVSLDTFDRLGDRGRRDVLVGVRVVDELLGVEVTPELARRARSDPKVRSLAGTYIEGVLTNRTGEIPSSSLRDEFERMGLLQAGLGLALVVFRPTASDYRAVPLSSRYHRLYYVLRPARLSKKATKGLFSVIRPSQ